ncbi:MAG: AAA family ATPase [Ignavibacteria bacterium]
MKIKSLIVICGRISSGKTYTANLISKQFGFPIASFGIYLLNYCQNNNLPTDRKTLQDVGKNLVRTNPEQFSKDVINHFIENKYSIIIEGVRHKTIFEILNGLSDYCISIFVDAPQKKRYERYISRNKETDKLKTYNQFIAFDNHPVELEIESLKSLCNINVDSTTIYSPELIDFLSENLKN